jgi:hypothetical protein
MYIIKAGLYEVTGIKIALKKGKECSSKKIISFYFLLYYCSLMTLFENFVKVMGGFLKE